MLTIEDIQEALEELISIHDLSGNLKFTTAKNGELVIKTGLHVLSDDNQSLIDFGNEEETDDDCDDDNEFVIRDEIDFEPLDDEEVDDEEVDDN